MTGRSTVLMMVFLFAWLAAGAGSVRCEEIALLNRAGVGTAYVDTEDGSTIYLWSGVPVAYLEEDVIFGFNGRHLGWFEDGIVRGSRGMRVGYTLETIAVVGGTARVTRVKGVKQVKVPPIPPVPPPAKPAYIDMDSPVSLGELLGMGRL
jgi:hypothetical protein